MGAYTANVGKTLPARDVLQAAGAAGLRGHPQ